MNKDNLLWYSTMRLKDSDWADAHDGYPPGHFWSLLLTTIFDPPSFLGERFDRLNDLFHRADQHNVQALSACMPGVLSVLIDVENHQMDRAAATRLLDGYLKLLPFLLMRFKPLQDEITITELQLSGEVRVRLFGARKPGDVNNAPSD